LKHKPGYFTERRIAANHTKTNVCSRALDLGPEGGHKGGELIAAGTPEEIAACKASLTGQFLAEVMRQSPNRSSRAKPKRASV
jgi:hypothetical protein